MGFVSINLWVYYKLQGLQTIESVVCIFTYIYHINFHGGQRGLSV